MLAYFTFITATKVDTWIFISSFFFLTEEMEFHDYMQIICGPRGGKMKKMYSKMYSNWKHINNN